MSAIALSHDRYSFSFGIVLVVIVLMVSCSFGCASTHSASTNTSSQTSTKATENPLETLNKEALAQNWPFVEGMAKGISAPLGKRNDFSPYAEWYYGLAQYYRQKPEDAYMHFKHAFGNASDSSLKNEIRLWMAQSALASGFYAKTYELITTSKSLDLKDWSASLKDELLRTATIDTLAGIRAMYPDDRAFAHQVIVRMKSSKGDWRAQAEQLISQYQFTDLANNHKEENLNSQVLEVVVLLPFGIDKSDVRQTPRPNQPWLDLYDGLKLATKQLADSGITINLHCYDVKKVYGRLDLLLASDEIKNASFIIGPVVGLGSPLVAEFAEKMQIPMVNPLTNKVYWSEDNLYAWLTEPEANQVGKLLAAQAVQLLPCKKVAIVYGATAQDSVMAKDYRTAMQSIGAEISLFHKVGKNSAANLPKFLKNSGIDSTGHIFAPNDEDFVKIQLPSALSILKLKTHVLTYGDWLNAPNANLDAYERLGFYLTEPHLLNSDNEQVNTFNNHYAKQTHIWPSIIAAQGYEAMMFFGLKIGMLNSTHRNDINKAGILGGCYDFSNRNSNACIPIYQVKNQILERVDR